MQMAVGERGELARVRAVSEDRLSVHVEFRNQQVTIIHVTEPTEWTVGSVLAVYVDDGKAAEVPHELWPEPTLVGVVKIKLKDGRAVVDTSGRWRIFDNAEVSFEKSQTVEVCDVRGIVRVLSEKPIRYNDESDDDGDVPDIFRPPLDNVEFSDFGGMEDVRNRARELIELPLRRHAELKEIGARPIKGVLFTGLPGTGKTMLARIIAAKSGAAFYKVSGPEIFSKWYGESEKVLRDIFNDAARQDSAIIFFDEIDSVAGRRGDNSHEVSRRVVAQLLTLMDGFDKDDNVVVIAATNRPQDIDMALRRPGRFDWEIHFDLPGKDDREAILAASARGLATVADLPHAQVAAMTESWSAAELAAIWSEAALLAVGDGHSEVSAEDYLGGYERVGQQRQRIGSEMAEASQ